MGWKLGWKVVYSRNGKLSSAWERSKEAKCYYEVGKVTKPNYGNGPLAVFSNLRDALNFKHAGDRRRLYRCRYRPSNRRTMFFFYALTKRLRRFYYVKGPISKITCFPKGTVLASQVMLLYREV